MFSLCEQDRVTPSFCPYMTKLPNMVGIVNYLPRLTPQHTESNYFID